MKKLVATVICIAMVVSMSAHVFATQSENDPNEHRSVEEILNEYHEKSFATQNSSEPDSPAAYSRQSEADSKTLEEETVEALNAAGYEAYNVTVSNYETLEETLQTDLTFLGLNPNESYIVVISGEDSSDTAGSNARDSSLPEQDIIDDGGGSTFSYTYNGNTYTMRYLTISPSSSGGTAQTKIMDMLDGFDLGEVLCNALDCYISFELDRRTGMLRLGTVLSLCGVSTSDVLPEEAAELDYCVSVSWTRSCVQIYNDGCGIWETWSIVDYAGVQTLWDGRYYSNTTHKFKTINEEKNYIYYSPHYSDYTWRKQQAAIGRASLTVCAEYVGNMKVYSTLTQYFPESTTTPKWEFKCSYC